MKCWEALADGVCDAAILVRLEKSVRSEAQQSQVWIDRQMGKVAAGIKAMSTGLGETAFCAGNQYTLADVAVCCALSWIAFRFPEIDWRGEHANLAKLYDKVGERVSFKETVPQ